MCTKGTADGFLTMVQVKNLEKKEAQLLGA